jgi:hypothetical protein
MAFQDLATCCQTFEPSEAVYCREVNHASSRAHLLPRKGWNWERRWRRIACRFEFPGSVAVMTHLLIRAVRASYGSRRLSPPSSRRKHSVDQAILALEWFSEPLQINVRIRLVHRLTLALVPPHIPRKYSSVDVMTPLAIISRPARFS